MKMPTTTTKKRQTRKSETRVAKKNNAANRAKAKTARDLAREIKPRRIRTGKVGAPRVDIKKSDLRVFLKEGLTLREIAQIYQCHPSTISKRKKEFGITVPLRRRSRRS